VTGKGRTLGLREVT